MMFEKFHEFALDTVSSALDLLTTAETKTSAIEVSYVEIGPLRDPSGSQINYPNETSGFHYLDISNTTIHVQYKVLKADGSNIPDSTDDLKVILVTNNFH